MKKGYLSQYFSGLAAKLLSDVELPHGLSTQHEFHGGREFRVILGEPAEKKRFDTRFMFLSDDSEEPVIGDGVLTWYDPRKKGREERGIMRWEPRLYYTDNDAVSAASAGDLLVLALRADGTLMAIVAKTGTTVERQIRWLFDIPDDAGAGLFLKEDLETERDQLGYAARSILEQIGIEIEDATEDYLDRMLAKFEGRFPRTKDFSEFARGTVKEVSPADSPDDALVSWIEQEERLYRALEKHLLKDLIKKLLASGFEDPDPLLELAMSTFQRRKSRAGRALENHLEFLFSEQGISYTRTGVTESNLQPDFIFPGISQYHAPGFPLARLTMLASKSTCKDRWRQILNEAAKIPLKHLVTLEPGISENQTAEMQAEKVQLVLPQPLHQTYTPRQQEWLISLKDFLTVVRQRQLA